MHMQIGINTWILIYYKNSVYRLLEKTSYALNVVICIRGLLNLIQTIIKFNIIIVLFLIFVY